MVPVKDHGSAYLLFWDCIPHESRESALIRRLALGCRVAVDIGAHVGYYSRLIWQMMQGKGSIYAFEPDPRTFIYLEENVRGRPGLSAYKMALGESHGRARFFSAVSSDLGSTVRQVGVPVTVDCTTLDLFCQSLCIADQVDFVKLDVEGGEAAVLRGARQVRSGNNPPIWMIEVIDSFLLEAGTSPEEMTTELLWAQSGSPHLFYLDRDGAPKEIKHLSERQQTSNVFVVPEVRVVQFIAAARKRDL